MSDSADLQDSIVVDNPDDPSGSVTPPMHHRSLQPVSPLAPLEYLQNQRRGSITDPSLHAHTTPPSRESSMLTPPGSGRDETTGGRTKSIPLVTKPDTPYVFGDATATANSLSTTHPPTDKNLRRLLHSPTDPSQSPPFRSFSDPQRPPEFTRAMSGPPEQRQNEALITTPHEQGITRRRSNELEIRDGPRKNGPTKTHFPSGEGSSDQQDAYPPGFDWGMRRHSIAVGGSNGLLNRSSVAERSSLGLKRKLSFERMHHASPLNEEMGEFGQTMSPDVEAPALKSRRGSAFNTRAIAELSIHDRRDVPGSVNHSPQQYWDRRDSIASTFSNLSSAGGYASSGFSGESIPRSMQTFAWPGNNPSDQGLPPGHAVDRFQHEGDTPMTGTSRPFDARADHPMANALPTPLQGMSDSNGRRMSVPDVAAPSSGADRPRRIRPRPSSRGSMNDPRHINTQTLPPLPHGGKIPVNGNVNDVSPPHSASSTGSTLGPPGLPRDANSPYSRSPELRVSHKLAERKRRKEMKELFDELRDQLPADRSMKASKWEILSKAIDYINYLSTNLADSQRQVESLRSELDNGRNPNSHYPSVTNPPIVHSQGPSIVTAYGLSSSDPGSGPASASSTTSRSTSVHPYPAINGTRRSPPM